jgi:transglutaminase-like putative cysteine protease
MRDAAVERLVKIISEKNDDSSGGKDTRSRRPLEVHIGLAEGWFSLFLVATVVYSTIWSVQSAGWVEHLNILTLTTLLGLVGGVLAAKQQHFSRLLIHCLAIVFGLLLAFWQTAGAFYDGNTAEFVHGLQRWFVTITHNGATDDNSIFLFFIVTLGFILAYTSAWLVYRTRSPWLMIVANAVVLLINLSNVDAGYTVFLVVFLVAALLLLLRFNLYESVKRWQWQGLRYADDIGWDVMQAGALLSIGILIFSWLLPAGYLDPAVSQVWTMNANPWVQFQNTWNRAFAVDGGAIPPNRGNFRDTLVLGGNPNLNNEIVFNVKSDDTSQYLQSISYDTYTSERGWMVSPYAVLKVDANQQYSSGAQLTHLITQKITVVNPPGEQYAYLFGAPQIVSTSLKPNLWQSEATGEVTAWLGQNSYLANGTTYTVASSVSSADEKALGAIPMPADAPKTLPPIYGNYDEPAPVTYFNPAVVHVYTQLPNQLDPRIAALAKKITANSPTMYDKAFALEKYLRENYAYDVRVQRPQREDGVAWFLFDNPNKSGYCNYFASAMAVMARSLGIPARVVAGYTNGTLDAKSNQHVVRGKDAHAWTQIYFGGYGWINFEPSRSFATFTRPLPTTSGTDATGAIGSAVGGLGDAGLKGKRPLELDNGDGGSDGSTADMQGAELVRQRVGTALGGLILLLLFGSIIFGIWWQRLFRRYSLSAQLYGRVCVLASWAGIKLRPSQTPYEYMRDLATVTPKDSELIERLGDIYVRERWADPESEEHPRRKGELAELPGMWSRLQPRLFFYVLRHPHFLRSIPLRVGNFFSAWRARHRRERFSDEEDF